jgi:dinuclear metal center YbgI/SA1388 family protein
VVRVREIQEAVEGIAPASLAEDWDNVGLQVGNPNAEVNRVLVALTPLPEVFEEAEEIGADFLFFHHPLIFRPLKSVNTGSYPGDLVARAIRGNLAVHAAHTNYDAAPGGVSVALAEALELTGPLKVVVPKGSMKKIVVFVPEDDADAMGNALTEAGAGAIGDYTHCTFRSPGTGTFFGGEGTDPYAGERGKLERVPELRLETVVPDYLLRGVVAAIRASHPYEEPAFDVYPVDGHPEGCGFGRVGRLPEPLSPQGLAGHVSEALGFPVRLVSDPAPGRPVERVAVLGGSGGSFLGRAAASGADAYVTGDLSYHDALLAESLGLVAVDAGHAATELPSLAPLAKTLGERMDIPISVSRVRR